MNAIRVWLLASRPATLTAAVAPVLVGTAVAVAEAGFRFDTMLAALFGAMLIQVGTNFANDVFDYEKGADGADRLGPTRAVQAGLLTPRAVRIGMVVTFLLATVCGVYLTLSAGAWIILIGVLSIASGILYTAGPYPLAYIGLGDVFVFVFFGLVAVMGTTFVQTSELSVRAAIASVPVGALATAILAVNNLRDRHQDVRANKRTIAVRFGGGTARFEYVALLVAAYAAPLALFALGLASTPVLLPLMTAPWAFGLWRTVRTEEGAPLNAALAKTAKLLLAFSILLAIGFVL